MRKNIVAGNWKMNLDKQEGIILLKECLSQLSSVSKTEVIFATSYIHLDESVKICNGNLNTYIAAQDCSSKSHGAFTGEVSAKMIKSCGARYVILGHSERRLNHSETNNLLRLKVEQALENKLKVIFCCGETIEKRDNNIHFKWIESQIEDSLFYLSEQDFSQIVIAYEPIWAIGTGMTATSLQAQEVHSFIRQMIIKRYGKKIGENTSILYGGSCNSSNAYDLFSQQDIDGGLIGGASLNAEDFINIIHSF